jgi:hypothetical protein
MNGGHARRAGSLCGAAGISRFGHRTGAAGEIAVLGNHDWWYDGQPCAMGSAARAVTVLENSAVRVTRGRRAVLGGRAGRHGVHEQEPSSADALAGVRLRTRADAHHYPTILRCRAEWRDVGGPPHCGQVVIPILGRVVHASRGANAGLAASMTRPAASSSSPAA